MRCVCAEEGGRLCRAARDDAELSVYLFIPPFCLRGHGTICLLASEKGRRPGRTAERVHGRGQRERSRCHVNPPPKGQRRGGLGGYWGLLCKCQQTGWLGRTNAQQLQPVALFMSKCSIVSWLSAHNYTRSGSGGRVGGGEIGRAHV